MPQSAETQLLDLTRQLLNSIADQDWSTYTRLCDPSLTCFEPESRGQLVAGMDFHKFYFDLKGSRAPRNTTLVAPQVRLLGPDAAVVSYVRLIQKIDGAGGPVTSALEETRVWQRIQGEWKHVHFHRSETTNSQAALS
jgi:Calcium/calmodulin dependent protein kinase II association domain